MKWRYQHSMTNRHKGSRKKSIWSYSTNQYISLASNLSSLYVSIYLCLIWSYFSKLNWMTNQEGKPNDDMSSSLNSSFYYFLYSSQIDYKLILVESTHDCSSLRALAWQSTLLNYRVCGLPNWSLDKPRRWSSSQWRALGSCTNLC